MGDSKFLTMPDGNVDQLTKREYFAALCFVGILSSEGAIGTGGAGRKMVGAEAETDKLFRRNDARRACQHADALIEALNEEENRIDSEALTLMGEAVGFMSHLSKWDPGGSPENDAAEFEIRLRAALRKAGVDAYQA